VPLLSLAEPCLRGFALVLVFIVQYLWNGYRYKLFKISYISLANDREYVLE
jgi:hypothetical protein